MNRLFKKIVSIVLLTSIIAISVPDNIFAKPNIQNVPDNIKYKKDETQQKLKDAGNIINKEYNNAKDKALEASGVIKENATNAYNKASIFVDYVVTKIDTKKFEQGWDMASEFVSANYSAAIGSNYVNNVQKAITETQNNIVAVCNNKGPTASRAGFVAEEWHTGTFNVDAAVRDSKYKAERLGSNAKASVDIAIKNGDEVVSKVSSKYYKDATGSANAQAKNIMQDYYEYLAKESNNGNSNTLSFEDYLDKNVQLKEAYEIMESEYASEYAGQTRLIPEGQLDDAAEYLRKRVNKEANKDGVNRSALSESTKETLDNLSDQIVSKDGTKSTPLSADEAKAIVELCDDGEFDIEYFEKSINVSQVIAPKYILKQSISAGTQAAAIQMALEVGPDIFAILREGIESGKIDKEQLEKDGIDAAIAGAKGFVEGSVSSALIIACQSGRLGVSAKKLSPEVIGSLTVVIIDSIRYGYKLSKGEITAEQYGDLIAEEIFVAIVSHAAGTTLAILMPYFPLAYMAGSMVGGMMASAAYEHSKEVVLQVAACNGFEAVVPTSVANTFNVGEESLKNINIKNKANELKNMIVNTTKEGLIRIKVS